MNDRRPLAHAVLELGVYMMVVAVVVDPGRLEPAWDAVRWAANRVRYRFDVLDTLAQIRSLPEE